MTLSVKVVPDEHLMLVSHKRRIAVLTSGGDAPGMNGAIRSVVRMAIFRGCEAFAIYEGYEGLIKGGKFIQRMYWEDVRGYLSEGGTLIGTARCAEFRTRQGRLAAAGNLIKFGIDALVVCGGDGSLTGANTLQLEWSSLLDELIATHQYTAEQVAPHRALSIVGLVGSIDNDMSGTDATIGCYSALHRVCEMIDYIDSTAVSHQRAFIIEVMGRHCGWLALMAGIGCGADFIFIPESPPEVKWEEKMCSMIEKKRLLGKRQTIVIVAEGAIDRNLNRITTNQIKDILIKNLNLDTRITTLGHVQRGGPPCAYDRLLSTLQGAEAVSALLEPQAANASYSPVICINEDQIKRRDLMTLVEQTQSVARAIEERKFDKAKLLRNAEFSELNDAFQILNHVGEQYQPLPMHKRIRIGIIHVGAPAGGMNDATRAAVAYCLTQGHTPVALYNGFPGLCRHHDDKPLGSVRELEWLDVATCFGRGGSEIGTNRGLPSEDMATTAECFRRYKIQALFIIGGFEAFTAASQLRNARDEYESLCIPMVVLPATVSNNVPGTEYSLGSDTCTNALIQYCDACRLSASASRRRVFVIETQGGASGFIATVVGLCVGAISVYTPEEGITLDMIKRDIDHLRKLFENDRGASRTGKIILRNERASSTYTTQVIADIIRDAGKGKFETRIGIPGHFQQGTRPSPMDRVRATRFAIRSIQHIEQFLGGDSTHDETMIAEERKRLVLEREESVSILGLVGSNISFTPIVEVEKQTNWHDRRPKHDHWAQLKKLVRMLSARTVVETTGDEHVVVDRKKCDDTFAKDSDNEANPDKKYRYNCINGGRL